MRASHTVFLLGRRLVFIIGFLAFVAGCGGGTSGTGGASGGGLGVTGVLRQGGLPVKGVHVSVASLAAQASPHTNASMLSDVMVARAYANTTQATTDKASTTIPTDVTDDQGAFMLVLDQKPTSLSLRFQDDRINSTYTVSSIPVAAASLNLGLDLAEDDESITESSRKFEDENGEEVREGESEGSKDMGNEVTSAAGR